MFLIVQTTQYIAQTKQTPNWSIIVIVFRTYLFILFCKISTTHVRAYDNSQKLSIGFIPDHVALTCFDAMKAINRIYPLALFSVVLFSSYLKNILNSTPYFFYISCELHCFPISRFYLVSLVLSSSTWSWIELFYWVII